MDLNKLNSLPPASNQNPKEWREFMGFIHDYFMSRGIVHPIVVELGTEAGRQKAFYEELIYATHIGIDHNPQAVADIYGDSQSPETLKQLKKRLGRKSVNLLFIDAAHTYRAVKTDYLLYSPLVKNLVVFHDIKLLEIKKFWEELKEIHSGNRFHSIMHTIKNYKHYNRMGIGVEILK